MTSFETKVTREEFQFPSNGKLHSNFRQHTNSTTTPWHVSIPFKRETAFKLKSNITVESDGDRFQFPSNGKLHSNMVVRVAIAILVAFQFPSNGKLHSNSPFLNSMGPWLHTPQHQTRTARRFFAAEIKRENATNPHQH